MQIDTLLTVAWGRDGDLGEIGMEESWEWILRLFGWSEIVGLECVAKVMGTR